jgi:hypothetical protein
VNFKYRINSIHDKSFLEIQEMVKSCIDSFHLLKMEFIKCQIGYPAGLEFNNWKEMELRPNDILPLLDFVQKQTGWNLTETDFRMFTSDFDLEFCHEGGFHFSFMKRTPFIECCYEIANRNRLISSVQVNKAIEEDDKKVKNEEYWKEKKKEWIEIDFTACEKPIA